MTREPDELERYLDDFGGRLRAVRTDPAAAGPRRRRLAVGVTAAVAAAVAAVVLLVGSGGGVGDRLDIVAEARAALSPPGEIVHMVIRHELPYDDGPAASSSVTERWTAVDPPRWRFIQELPHPEEGRGRFFDAEGSYYGRQEFAYADGVQRWFIAQRNRLRIQGGFSGDGPAAQAPGFCGAGGDPQADLRAMLDRGEVTDAGERQIGGRTVRRLVSEDRTLVYDVDPDTFAPVQWSLSLFVGRGVPETRSSTVRFVVERYERIPITPESAELLTITTDADTEVTVRTAEDLRRRQEAMRGPSKRRDEQASEDKGCPGLPPYVLLPPELLPGRP
jgi:hypothetical protein